MTAPDKSLRERLMACVEPHDEGLIDAPAELLREAAAELSSIDATLARRPAIADIPSRAAKIERLCTQNNRLDGQQAELSRMRTALEEITVLAQRLTTEGSRLYRFGVSDGRNQCAAIAERALTATADSVNQKEQQNDDKGNGGRSRGMAGESNDDHARPERGGVEIERHDGTAEPGAGVLRPLTHEDSSGGNAAYSLITKEWCRRACEEQDIPSCPHGVMAGPCPECSAERALTAGSGNE